MTEVSPGYEEHFLQTIHKMAFLLDRRADSVLSKARHGTFSRFLVLTALTHCPGVSQREIASFLNLTPAAVSRQVESLVRAKLLSRSPAPGSRRENAIRLTKKGAEEQEAMKKILVEGLRSILKSVSRSDMEFVTKVLNTILLSLSPGDTAFRRKIITR